MINFALSWGVNKLYQLRMCDFKYLTYQMEIIKLYQLNFMQLIISWSRIIAERSINISILIFYYSIIRFTDRCHFWSKLLLKIAQ